MAESFWKYAICIVVSTAMTCNAIRKYSMDRQSTCDQTVRVGEEPVLVTAKSVITSANPRRKCVLKLQADIKQNTRNRMEITIKKVDIRDCGVKLEIFDHDGPIGQNLKVISCNYRTLGVINSESHIITLKFTRPIERYQMFDFEIEFRAYSDDGGTANVIGTTRLKSWMIAIIVIGCILLIGVIIFLCCMCAAGRLPGMSGPPERMRRVRVLRTTASKNPAVGEKSGVDNPAISRSVEVLNEKNGGLKIPSLDDAKEKPLSEKPRLYLQAGEPKQVGRAAAYHAVSDSVDIKSGMSVNGPFKRGDPVRVSAGSMSSEKRGRSTPVDSSRQNNHKVELPLQKTENTKDPQFFKNPDAEGYHYSYDHLYPNSGVKMDNGEVGSKNRSSSQSEGRAKRRHQRLTDQRKDTESSAGSRETNIDDVTDDDNVIENSKIKDDKLMVNVNQGPLEDKSSVGNQREYKPGHAPEYYASIDQHSEPDITGTISNPVHSSDGTIRSRVNSNEELDNDDANAEMRKHKADHRNDKRPNKQKFVFPIPDSANPNLPSRDFDIDNKHGPANGNHAPSAAYGSILSRTTGQNAPTYMYAFESRANNEQTMGPVAGKAAWYMHTTPSQDGPMTQGALVIQADPHPLNQNDQRGKSPKPKSAFSAFQPPPSYGKVAGYPSSNDRAYQTSDIAIPPSHKQQPGTRTASAKTGIDPRTGNQVSQTIWTDNNPDPTDPVGYDDPSITRRTVARVTTNAGPNPIPNNAYPLVDQLSFHNQSLRNDPSAIVLGGQPMIAEPMYAKEYPRHDNSAYYLGKGDKSARVIHDPPKKSSAVRDKISVSDI